MTLPGLWEQPARPLRRARPRRGHGRRAPAAHAPGHRPGEAEGCTTYDISARLPCWQPIQSDRAMARQQLYHLLVLETRSSTQTEWSGRWDTRSRGSIPALGTLATGRLLILRDVDAPARSYRIPRARFSRSNGARTSMAQWSAVWGRSGSDLQVMLTGHGSFPTD